MTAGSTQHTERLTRNNAVLLLVDHQVDLYTGVRDLDILQLKHNEGGVQPSGAVIFLPVFGQPAATRRRTRLEGVLAVFGEIRGGGPVWDVKSGGTACVLVADCQWPQSRARLKPETTRVTLEEFRPTHDFFDYRPSDPTSRWTPCPPENSKQWLQVGLGCDQLSLSCPFRPLHTFCFLRPARLRTPLLGYGAPHLSARGTLTLLNSALLSAHIRIADNLPRTAAAD
jgi:hypothetical protein